MTAHTVAMYTGSREYSSSHNSYSTETELSAVSMNVRTTHFSGAVFECWSAQ